MSGGRLSLNSLRDSAVIPTSPNFKETDLMGKTSVSSMVSKFDLKVSPPPEPTAVTVPLSGNRDSSDDDSPTDSNSSSSDTDSLKPAGVSLNRTRAGRTVSAPYQGQASTRTVADSTRGSHDSVLSKVPVRANTPARKNRMQNLLKRRSGSAKSGS